MKTYPSIRPMIMAVVLCGATLIGTARADAVDDITKAGILTVGVFEDFPPFASAGSDMASTDTTSTSPTSWASGNEGKAEAVA